MLSKTEDFSFFVIDGALVFHNLHTLNQTFKTNKQSNKQINKQINKQAGLPINLKIQQN